MSFIEIAQKTLTGIRRVGFGNTLRTLQCTLQKVWQERRIDRFDEKIPVTNPGALSSVAVQADGARFHFDHAELEIIFLAPDLARVSWSPGIPPLPYALEKTDWPEISIACDRRGEEWVLESGELSVRVRPDGGVGFFWPIGELLRYDRAPELHILSPGGDNDGDTHERESHTLWAHISELPPDSVICGLGERAFPLNLSGGTYRMWNRDPEGSYRTGDDPLYVCIPVYLALHSSGSYLFFYENPFPGEISFRDEKSVARFEDGMLRYYFIPGPPDHAIERYTELTGRPELPPKWSLGYHQSRWGYKTEADIREVVNGFRENDLPLSAIHLDIDYMDGFRVFTVDRERFPDLAGLTEELAQMGIRTVMILDPGVRIDPDYPVYQSGVAGRHFCTLPNGRALSALVWPGWSAFPDFSSASARAWWGGQYQKLVDWGAAGVWHDMNEPSSFTAWGDMTIPLNTCHSMEGREGFHREVHNLYGLLMNKAGFEALRELRPANRPWLLSRSGWAGNGRYAWNWTGDTESSWEMLRQTIPTVLGMGLSGIPYSGPDIGGFGGDPSEELYLRWFQLATFMPFFRTHSAVGTPPREPWRFGEETLNIARKFLQIRYRLLPYIYTLAWEASQTGHPLIRPLFWPRASDPTLWEVDDCFLLGDDLLVTPILEPGASRRQVILPEGAWYDFWDDTPYSGPSKIESAAALSTIPLFVRGGSVLPFEEEHEIILNIYPAHAGEHTRSLYFDSGDGYGHSRIDRFETIRGEQSLAIHWKKDGAFPFPYEKVSVLIHGMDVQQALVDGDEASVENNQIETGKFDALRIEF